MIKVIGVIVVLLKGQVSMEILTTERLILRPFQTTDLEALYSYAQNPLVGPSAGWKPHSSIEESQVILDRFIKGEEVWAIIFKETGQLIGSIGLHDDPKRPDIDCRMIGYVLNQSWWGLGLTTEAAKRMIRYAFEVLNIIILSVYHYPFNNRSQRVIEKCGFKYEGTLRKASCIYNGKIFDDVCYSITREEYNMVKLDRDSQNVQNRPINNAKTREGLS